jgi:hypothetical protein
MVDLLLRRYRRIIRVCFVLAAFVPALVQADDRLSVGDFSLGADERGVPRGWQLSEKAGHAAFSLTREGQVPALCMQSTNTSFSFQRKVNADLNQFPVLSWKWKVTHLPKGGDFRKSSTDDQAAQLFVAFGRTRSIVYLWDSTAPEGLMADAISPPFMSVKVVVVRSGPANLGRWITESRNVYEDYKKLFGTTDNPPMVSGMRMQINTQHTRTSGECAFADLTFAKK